MNYSPDVTPKQHVFGMMITPRRSDVLFPLTHFPSCPVDGDMTGYESGFTYGQARHMNNLAEAVLGHLEMDTPQMSLRLEDAIVTGNVSVINYMQDFFAGYVDSRRVLDDLRHAVSSMNSLCNLSPRYELNGLSLASFKEHLSVVHTKYENGVSADLVVEQGTTTDVSFDDQSRLAFFDGERVTYLDINPTGLEKINNTLSFIKCYQRYAAERIEEVMFSDYRQHVRNQLFQRIESNNDSMGIFEPLGNLYLKK